MNFCLSVDKQDCYASTLKVYITCVASTLTTEKYNNALHAGVQEKIEY